MPQSNRRTILKLGAASIAALGLGLSYRAGRFGSPAKRDPDLTDINLAHLAEQARDSSPPRVLVIGNSATIGAGFLERLTEQVDGRARIARASASGARLVQSLRVSALRELVRDIAWDALVLQDFSSTPLHAADRLGSRIAITQFARLAAPASVVLFPHWPSAVGHPVYRDTFGLGYDTPEGPQDYARRAEAHYASCAHATGGILAPVLPAWIAALERGDAIYQGDRHHASPLGAAVAAAALWPSIDAALKT